MSFRRRTYIEVLENILTSITGGISSESHPFPMPDAKAPPYSLSLQQPPVSDVVSLYGSMDGKPYLFRKDVDYKLMDDKQTIQWQEGANLPDPGTILNINYYSESVQPILTDIYTGSVIRTLTESVALEIARLYAQLELVYQSGFIDTASSRALENVVALLGITRIKKGRPAGEVEFQRAPGSRGAITIPAGTRVMTADGNVEYETTESVTMPEGQNTIRVVARDLELNDPLPADSLSVMSVPIAGIGSVINPAPTAHTTQDETDSQLRTRAKNFLHGSERATLGAIKEAIARQGITADIEEPGDTPGIIKITPHAQMMPSELQQRLLTAIEATRPAGVLWELKGVKAPKKINLNLRITTAGGLLEQDLRAVQKDIRNKIEGYFEQLPVKESGSINRIIGEVLSIPEVEDIRIQSAIWEDGKNALDLATGKFTIEEEDITAFSIVLGELHVADPNLPTLLSAVVLYDQGETPPNAPSIQTALTDTVTYLNEINADEGLQELKRTLSYGKLLYVLPLPNKDGESMEEYDEAQTPPALPDETTISPYKVEFIITQETGLSKILSKASDDYLLTPLERLSLSSVEVREEANNA